MSDSDIDSNLNFKRAMILLETRINSPLYLIAMWRMLDCKERVPWPEKIKPWYSGLESLIS